MSIEVKGLSKSYEKQIAVNAISFSVNKGDIVGFLGPNGAGKSTTMKMITGYLPPDAGTVSINGLDITRNSLKAKRLVGYLPEANPLYNDLYVKEYLSFVANIYKMSNVGKRVTNMVDYVGLGEEQHKKITQLSKGYKQRVGLAAALIHDPEILILDEPTSGLDPNQIIEIRALIKKEGANKTVLFSSHILQEVTAICNRVIILAKGNIKVNDSLTNLTANTNNKIVKVLFDEPLEPAWLQRLPSVTSVSKRADMTWELGTENILITKKEVLQLAAENNLNIASLQTGGNNLEEIFAALTK